MGRGRKEAAPTGRRRQVLQIGSLSRHQPKENNLRENGTLGTAAPSHHSSVATPPRKQVAAQGQGFSLLGAYEASGSEDEGEIDDQVKDFLKELQEDDSGNTAQTPAACTATSEAQSSAAESTPVWHECLDPNSGHVYYWNTVTNEVSWTLPEDYGATIQAPAAAAGSISQANAEVQASGAAYNFGSSGKQSAIADEDGNVDETEDEADGMMADDDSDCNIEDYDDTGDMPAEAQHTSPAPLAEAGDAPVKSITSAIIARMGASLPDGTSAATSAAGSARVSDDEGDGNGNTGGDEDVLSACGSDASGERPRAASVLSVASPRADQEEAQQSVASSPAVGPLSAPLSPCPGSPLESGEVAGDSDSDCNIEQYDEEEEESGKMIDSSARKADEQMESTSAGSSTYGDRGLADMLFADTVTAEKFGYKAVAVTSSSGSNSPVREGRLDKTRAKLPSASLTLLKPRSVARTDSKRGASPRLDISLDNKISPMAEQASKGVMDIFADEALSTDAAAASAPSSADQDVTQSALTPGQPPDQPVSSVGSSSCGSSDLGDFDIDAALEESLENARSSGKAEKRVHSTLEATATENGERDARDAMLDGADDGPAKKRVKLSVCAAVSGDDDEDEDDDEDDDDDDDDGDDDDDVAGGVDVDSTAAHGRRAPAVCDMDLAAESDTEMDGTATEQNGGTPADSDATKQATAPSSLGAFGDQLLTLASELAAKLKFLNITTNEISNLHLALVRAETRLADWQAGALDGAYAVRMLESSIGELNDYEKLCAPPGWQCLWDSSTSRYYYHDTLTGETRWDYPSEQAKLAGQQQRQPYVMDGYDQASVAMFAGAMAATYHTYIYGNYHAAYAAMPITTTASGTVAAPMPALPESTASAPPLPTEEPPPPPPGVDDPPPPPGVDCPPSPINPPPPPPPPDDEQPALPGCAPPPLPSEDASPSPPPDSDDEDGSSGLKATSAVVIQAAAAIFKPAPSAVADEAPSEAAVDSAIKAVTEDPLQMRMRATLVARGMSEADINEYFVQQTLQQMQESSQPGSPKASSASAKAGKKEKKKKKEAKNLGSSGLVPKKKKNMSALVDKWSSIRQQELEDEKADSEEDDPVRIQQRKIQEWKASQLAGGAAHSNPNFEEVSGDWRERVKRSKR